MRNLADRPGTVSVVVPSGSELRPLPWFLAAPAVSLEPGEVLGDGVVWSTGCEACSWRQSGFLTRHEATEARQRHYVTDCTHAPIEDAGSGGVR